MIKNLLLLVPYLSLFLMLYHNSKTVEMSRRESKKEEVTQEESEQFRLSFFDTDFCFIIWTKTSSKTCTFL